MENRLKELRIKKGITQVQLAKTLFVRQSSISAWENGTANPDFDNQRKLAELYGVTIDELFGRETAPAKNKGVKIPVLGRVQAGIPMDAIEEVLDYEEITESMAAQGEYFGLVVRGDSMFPKMVEDDIVIVRKQSDVESGDVAIVCINGDKATCKQLKKHANGITLIPYNTAYEPMFFTEQEVHDKPITVLGKVVELRGKF